MQFAKLGGTTELDRQIVQGAQITVNFHRFIEVDFALAPKQSKIAQIANVDVTELINSSAGRSEVVIQLAKARCRQLESELTHIGGKVFRIVISNQATDRVNAGIGDPNRHRVSAANRKSFC